MNLIFLAKKCSAGSAGQEMFCSLTAKLPTECQRARPLFFEKMLVARSPAMFFERNRQNYNVETVNRKPCECGRKPAEPGRGIRKL